MLVFTNYSKTGAIVHRITNSSQDFVNHQSFANKGFTPKVHKIYTISHIIYKLYLCGCLRGNRGTIPITGNILNNILTAFIFYPSAHITQGSWLKS